MSAYNDYILQHFADKEGNLETNKPYECRLCWFKNDYPPFKELEKICKSTEKTIQKYSSLFNWKAIRQKAEDLKQEDELREQKERQDNALQELDEINNTRLRTLQKQLNEVEKLLSDENLSNEEKKELRKEQREILKEYHLVQKDKLRTVNLPDKLNDKQEHQHNAVIDLDLHLKSFLS